MGSQRLPRFAPQPLRLAPPTLIEDAPAVQMPASWRTFAWPWPDSPRLSEILTPEANSFGVLRLALALAVLISHTVFLHTGHHAAEPLVGLTGYSLGQYAVQGFFILSGILVAQSLVTRANLSDYVLARALRIFPALIVCVLATAFVAGPALTFFGLNGYFTSSGVPNYVLQTLSLSTGSAMLPGVFALNPVGGAVNQSIWTLKYEVACYGLLGGLAFIAWRLKAGRGTVGALLAAWGVIMLIMRPGLTADATFPTLLAYFALFFGTGVTAFLLRTHLRISWQPLPALALLFVLAWGSDLAEITSAVFLAYGLLWLATRSFGGLRVYTTNHDYSYGAYIYSFPVTQVLLSIWPQINLVSLLAATLALTLVLAFLSWELIERPALSFVRARRTVAANGITTTAASLDVTPVDVAPADRIAPAPIQPENVAPDGSVAKVPQSEPLRLSRIAAIRAAAALGGEQTTRAPTPAVMQSPPVVTVPARSKSLWRRPPAETATAVLPVDRSRLEARLARIAATTGPVGA